MRIIFTHSFGENHQWSEHFSQQPELLEYFENAYKYGIEKNTYFETEVISATFDELTNLWSVTSQNKNNKIQEKTNIIISCWPTEST